MANPLSVAARNKIEAHRKRGGYRTADEVVDAALAALARREQFGNFGPGELAEGEASGTPISGRKALEARRKRRRDKAASPRRARSA